MNKLIYFSRGALLALLASVATACHQPSGATATPATTANPAANVATQQTPAPNPEDAMPRVKVDQAKAEVDKGTAVIIDVRGTEAYKTAHIKGAIDYPLTRLEQSDFKDIPKGKHIIAYCTWPSEHTSARAALLLQKAGYKEASALLGGMSAWEAAGHEMVKAPPSTPPPAATPNTSGAFPVKPDAKPPAGKK